MSNADILTRRSSEHRNPETTTVRDFDGWWHVQQVSRDEEWANALSHAIGCLLSVAGAFLLWQHLSRENLWLGVSCLVFCAAMIAVYAASTLSHWVRTPVWRRRWRCWDQGLIYVLITATYTPLAVAYLTGLWHLLTAAMWGLAVAGFLSKVAMQHRVNGISFWLYLVLGWLPIVATPTLLFSAPSQVLVLVLVGGLAYTAGSAMLKYDERAPYLHLGWHLMVILGSALHFSAIWLCATLAT